MLYETIYIYSIYTIVLDEFPERNRYGCLSHFTAMGELTSRFMSININYVMS